MKASSWTTSLSLLAFLFSFQAPALADGGREGRHALLYVEGLGDEVKEEKDLDLDHLRLLETEPPEDGEQDKRSLLLRGGSIIAREFQIEESLREHEEELRQNEALEERLEEDAKRHEEAYHLAYADLQSRRELIGKRLHALGKAEGEPLWRDALKAPRLLAVLEKANARQVLLEGDRKRVEAYKRELERVATLKADLDRRKQNLRLTRLRISQLKDAIFKLEKEALALIKAVQEEPEFFAVYVRNREALDEALKDFILKLTEEAPRGRRGFFIEKRQGRLPFPIRNAETLTRYGKHRRLDVPYVQKGIEIAPLQKSREEDAIVRSVYWGYVAWVGRIEGLGRVVLVDHTDGYWSMYAHLREVRVAPQDEVKSGQMLGVMGESGSFFGPRLYMELRQNGVAINPGAWLSTR